MKVFFLLFLVLIIYSLSFDSIQNVDINGSRVYLRPSTNYDFFYIPINSFISNEFVYIFFLDNRYKLNDTIYYCHTNSYPSQMVIDSCSFIIKYKWFVKSIDEGDLYYYRLPILSNKNYIIIKYKGKYSGGIISVYSTVIPIIEKTYIDQKYDTLLSPISYNENYFYTNIPLNSYDYLHLYISDENSVLIPPIYYCMTLENPENHFPYRSCFNHLNYYEDKPNEKYEYYYKINTSSYLGGYVIIQYNVNSIYNILSIRIYSEKINSLSTVSIVLIAIGSVAFVGIIIGVII